MNNKLNSYMVQYAVWPNCCNNCEFCLRRDRSILTKQQQLEMINAIYNNIDYIDWTNKFSGGISLLGGEIFYIEDLQIQSALKDLIYKIINVILKSSKNPSCRFSTVTNGLYDPKFLFEVLDIFYNTVGLEKVDLNFSYDLKYRYKSQSDANHVLNLIKLVHQKYSYQVGVQMILTQNIINLCKINEFNITNFVNEQIPGNNLCFLYPHKIKTGKVLTDFFLNRNDFIRFILDMKIYNYQIYYSFVNSVKNSSLFKYSGIPFYRQDHNYTAQPILMDDKDIFNECCGHSILYQCYQNTNNCLLCDLIELDSDKLF